MAPNCKSSLFYCKTYPYSVSAVVLATLGFVGLIIAIASPFWLVSKEGPRSEFQRLGLWTVCFKRYHHPALPHVLDGCHPLHRHSYEEMRKWLQPAWFILVQCLVACATLISGLCVCLLGWMTFQEELEVKIFVAAFVFVFEAVSGVMTFLSVCIFGVMSFERPWITDPAKNALSWGFGFCVTSTVLLSLTSICLLVETLRMRRMLASNNKVYRIPLSSRPSSGMTKSY